MTPDSWAYWQGAVSIASGRGYSYFHGGLLITDWPPLYSLYIAAWQEVLGVSGGALVAGNVALTSIAAGLWFYTWAAPLREDSGIRAGWMDRVPLVLLALYIAVFTSAQFSWLMADGLRLALVPALLYTTWRVMSTNDSTHARWWIAAAVGTGILLMLAHNASIALIVAAALLLAFAGAMPRRRRLTAPTLLVAVPVLVWWTVRRLLGQVSHPLDSDAGRFAPAEYTDQLLTSLAYGIGPSGYRPGMALLAVVLGITALLSLPEGWIAGTLRDRVPHYLRMYLRLALLSTVILWVVFNITWIHEPLSGRFVSHLPLIVVPAMILLLHQRARWWTLAIAIAFVSQPLFRYAAQQAEDPAAYPTGVRHNDTIRPDFVDRDPEVREGVRVVAPPLYTWIEERMNGSVLQGPGGVGESDSLTGVVGRSAPR